ncbi:MAG: STAS domain-containing protein [Armatimonadetes bacterium]|nr:STAS domain-containing protein [Armatimonadota bacterium]
MATVFQALQSEDDPFIPRSITALRDYSVAKFTKDLIAGITVGLVALPLAMAFAISSGVLPQAGIYCAVVAGFLISALGGSTFQIGGPTGAFVVVVSGIVQKHGLDGLFMCTLIAGVMLVLLGITGLGAAVKYIPRPVVIGFTNGIAVLIASTQIKDFFGLEVDKVPGEFIPRIQILAQNFASLSLTTTLLSGCALGVIILCLIFFRKVPGAIVALVLGTAAAVLFHLPVETIATKFGGIPSGLPALHLPVFRADLILPLLSPALTVMMLGAIESLLSAMVADQMAGTKHNPHVELFAQGVANIVSPLFGGLPATGAIARTATNIRSGAQSPVSGMIHALTLLAILLVAAPLAREIPLGVLAAILLIVAYNMGEWREIPDILKLGKADIAVWLITFLLTVLADLTVAVEAGMILAALLFIRRISVTTTVVKVTPEYIEDGKVHSLQEHPVPEGAVVYRIHGPFLFGATDKIAEVERELETDSKVVMLRMRNMTAIDATGIHALESLAERLHAAGKTLILCGLRRQPESVIMRSSLVQTVGEENIQPHVAAAVARAHQILGSP